MKAIFSIIVLISICHSICAQIDHIKILIVNNESSVTKYLDSLNNLKSNSHYKVNKSVTIDGDLQLSTDFTMEDQEYYNCALITTVFNRIKGKEWCITQIIAGSVEFAQPNLAYIKDNFKAVSTGVWEKSILKDKFKIVAKFSRTEGEYPMYKIVYSLNDNN